jgi:uncharacterized protein YggE
MLNHKFLTTLALSGFLTLGSAYANDPTPRTISVQGNGQVMVDPNTATLQIAVETNAAQANEAVQKNAEQMTQVVNSLKKQLGKDDTLSTSRYNLNPVYQYDQTKQQNVLTGYQATNYVVVTTKQLDQLGKLLDSVAQAGANRVDSLEFSHDKVSQYQQEAMTDAVADAQQTAQVLAKAAGVNLGPVQQIQPQQNNVVPMMAMSMAKMGAGRESTPVEPGQLTVSMSVSMVYEID